MEMYQVRTFLAVARHLNFTRAARELGVAQPSLTRAIQRLEAEFGGPLFRRERAHTHLTELGRMILPHLEAAHAAADTAIDQVRRLRMLESGSLILGVCSSVEPSGLTALVTEVAGQIPSLELRVKAVRAEVVERRLMSGEFDAGVLAPTGPVNDRFDLQTIRTDELVVAFAPGHRFADRPDLPLEALDAEPLVVRCGCRHEEALAQLMKERRLRRTVRCRSNDTRWVAEFVRSGLGCAVVPATLAHAHGLPSSRLEGVELPYRTVLATAAGRRHPKALNALLERIRKETARASSRPGAACADMRGCRPDRAGG